MYVKVVVVVVNLPASSARLAIDEGGRGVYLYTLIVIPLIISTTGHRLVEEEEVSTRIRRSKFDRAERERRSLKRGPQNLRNLRNPQNL